jgi:hypothetical protein
LSVIVLPPCRKLLENDPLLLGRQARAVVAHPRAAPRGLSQAPAPALSPRDELHGVGEQVQHHLHQPVAIGHSVGTLAASSFPAPPLVLEQLAGGRRRLLDHLDQADLAVVPSAWPDSILAMSSTWLTSGSGARFR